MHQLADLHACASASCFVGGNMAHTMSEGATGEGPSTESREGEYINILTELRLTHQALEDQIYQFERLSQEISAIKAQLGLRLPIETVTSLVDGKRFSVEQEKTLLESCLA